MAIPVWPGIKYNARFEGFGVSLSDGETMTGTDMDNGEVRYRSRFRTTLSPMSLAIELSSADIATFKNFWKNDLRGGSFWFYMPVFTGTGYSTCLVRIDRANQPKITPLGWDTYELALSLIVRNLP